MIRKIIQINEEKCDGCGLCADACHEGAIEIVNGKAKLMRDDYCDGLGDCLPSCPQNAISFIEREAAAYDEAAVKRHLASQKNSSYKQTSAPDTAAPMASQLSQWPVQIKLAPVNAPYFDGARLLIAADCTAYAYGNFHQDFIRGKVTLIGCPKLDAVDYTDKLTAIIQNNNIKDVTIVRMEVPCCGGIEHAVSEALKNSGKWIPWQVVTISIKGDILQ